ncbi:hypothetical protein PN499_03365, partial [Kamptonema animale CS-326]|uniref:hypothetical protein n=1 Tax=Kamptonema animale TaxID=92934 RepID=UPI00232FF553
GNRKNMALLFLLLRCSLYYFRYKFERSPLSPLITIVPTVFRETAQTFILPLAMPAAGCAYATILEPQIRILPLH